MVDILAGRKIIDNKWVLKLKRKADGALDRYKTCLVTKCWIWRNIFSGSSIYLDLSIIIHCCTFSPRIKSNECENHIFELRAWSMGGLYITTYKVCWTKTKKVRYANSNISLLVLLEVEKDMGDDHIVTLIFCTYLCLFVFINKEMIQRTQYFILSHLAIYIFFYSRLST